MLCFPGDNCRSRTQRLLWTELVRNCSLGEEDQKALESGLGITKLERPSEHYPLIVLTVVTHACSVMPPIDHRYVVFEDAYNETRHR